MEFEFDRFFPETGQTGPIYPNRTGAVSSDRLVKKSSGDKSAKKCRVFCCQMELITCMLREEDGTMQQVDADVTAFPFVSFSFRGDNFVTTHPILNPFSYLYSLQFYLRNKTHFPYILK